jgi:hypothetical protein
MKKPKTVKSFYFTDHTPSQMVEEIDKKLPISIVRNEDLIDRIHQKYPDINKSSVALIVKEVFRSFRTFLVLGKVMNFNKLFFDCKLLFFPYRKNDHIVPSLKVKISTPPQMRKHEP